MFTACFDDRRLLPAYYQVFLQSALIHSELHLITRAKAINSYDGKKISLQSFEGLTVKNPFELPYYTHAIKLFEKNFFNYSTRKSRLEQACFNRWFALNAATCELQDDDYICLLDPDILLGSQPEDILSQCTQQEGQSFDIIAEWCEPLVSVGPELTIIKKQSLFEFCRFLITNYFSPCSVPMLQGEYFDRIGRGLDGGICDMRALACWIREGRVKSFNLNELRSSGLIRNLTEFISENKEDEGSALEIAQGKLTLLKSTGNKQLIGIHFQGPAKVFMERLLGGLGQTKILNLNDLQYQLSRRQKLERRLKLSAKKVLYAMGFSV
jgi:hypothetical protein